MKRLAVTVTVFALSLAPISGIESVQAGALVVESVPPDGDVVARAPGEIVLRFAKEIIPGKTRLFFSTRGGRGLPLPAQAKSSSPTDVLTIVLPPLGMGSYILRYRVVATDGESTSGSVSFTAGGF